MAAKPKLFTLRKHFKKSIFAACLAVYGSYYASGRYREYLVRRELCHEASKIGEEPISALQKPRSMYVFLNPQANDGKAVKLYEKNVAPILHLAGIDVTLIKTDYEGHAKSLLGYIDPNTDGIVIAGGSGTLMEVVTGLIRLQNEEAVSKIPIGVIPLGRNNGFFRTFNNSVEQDARNIGNATMAIVKGETKTADVLEIKSEGVRSTYALSGMNWGLFQQVKTKINAKKHWWAGPWKKQMAFITRTVKNWPSQFVMSLNFGNESEGEEKDFGIKGRSNVGGKDGNATVQGSSFLNVYEDDGVIRFEETENKENQLHLADKHLENKNDMEIMTRSQSVRTSGVNVILEKINNHSKLCLQIWKPEIKRSEFILDGWKWIESNYGKIETDNCYTISCDEINLQPENQELTWYSIDGEEFEAKPINIKIHRDKLKFFC